MTATSFNVEQVAQDIVQRCMPTSNYGLVYELWMNAFDDNSRQALADVPEEHKDAVKERLIELGALHPEDIEDTRVEDGLCIHYLDAQTCPCGCFE